MKTKKLTPRNAAPVQRENTATVSRDGNGIAIVPASGNTTYWQNGDMYHPFAGDDAE